MSKQGVKLQAVIDPHSSAVISSLIGIKGNTTSEVVAFALRQWISEHTDELKALGIQLGVSAIRDPRAK